MNNNKILFLLFCILLLGSFIFFSYSSRYNDKCREKMKSGFIKHIKKDLKLTETQAIEVKKILDDGWLKIEAEKNNMRQHVQTIRHENEAKIMLLLNDTQKNKFKARMKRLDEKRKKYKFDMCK